MYAATVAAQAGVVTREEALAAVYPDASVESERVFLTSEEIQRASDLSREEIESPLVARYVARQDGRVVGRAYVDTHVVRTKRESLLIALDSDGVVKRVEVTAFLEPREYVAPDVWLRQFDEQPLTDEMALQRAIRPIAGATLTAQSATQAVRRVMAIDVVLEARRQAGR
jgi:hypothetical protein